ncbi:6734_t:CDS:2, partial [Funneliformis geosporum]
NKRSTQNQGWFSNPPAAQLVLPCQLSRTLGKRVSEIHLAGKKPVKVLGTGELTKGLTIQAAAFSQSAQKKIIQAGGQA